MLINAGRIGKKLCGAGNIAKLIEAQTE